jgi:hypothetical protein
MKLLLQCHVCRFPSDVNEEPDPKFVEQVYAAQLNDEGVYVVDCAAGHTTRHVLQNEQYQLLFESAVLALAEGYYRESVASFAAALERFYALFCRVVCRHHGAASEGILATSKRYKLEQQVLGAMAYCYLLHTGKVFEDNESMRKFRNDVVHAGHWPTLEKTENYAGFVFDTITELRKLLQGTAKEAFEAEADAYAARAHQKARETPQHPPGPPYRSVGSIWIGTFIGQPRSSRGSHDRSFKEVMQDWLPGMIVPRLEDPLV